MTAFEIDSKAFADGLERSYADIGRACEREVHRTGELASVTARRLAPRRTGALVDSIVARARGNATEVSAGVDYAAFVEYGTSDTPAQPFLRPALEQAARSFGRDIRI